MDDKEWFAKEKKKAMKKSCDKDNKKCDTKKSKESTRGWAGRVDKS